MRRLKAQPKRRYVQLMSSKKSETHFELLRFKDKVGNLNIGIYDAFSTVTLICNKFKYRHLFKSREQILKHLSYRNCFDSFRNRDIKTIMQKHNELP